MADRTLTHAASLVPIGAFAGKPAMPLSRAVVSVGSGKQNRIQLKSDTVSTTHALLVHTDAGWYVRDLGSRTHTILNGKVAREATLKNGDTLTIGAFVFHFVTDDRREPVAPVQAALEITDAELPVPLDTRTIVIGRRQGCEVRLLEDSASLVHAILFEVDGHHYVRDLYSRNGTFLNGKKVHQERLSFGDEIVVGETHLKYVADTSVSYEEELTPTPVESDLPIAIEDDSAIPLSTTARDTIDADREEGVEADAPVLPLSRRDRFESLAPSEPPVADESIASEAPLTPSFEVSLTPTAVRSDPVEEAIDAAATHVIDEPATAEPATSEDVAIEHADALVADLAPSVEPLAESTLELSPVEAAQSIDEPAVDSVVVASATIDDALDAPVAEQTAPDDDEADILGLAPPAHASHVVAPIDDVALAPADAIAVDVRPPDVIAVPHAAGVTPEPPTEMVAVDAPEPVEDFADSAEAIAPIADDAELHSSLEPIPTPAPAGPDADAPATPAEAVALARLEAQVRSALDDPSRVVALPSLVSGDESADASGDVATQLGEATRRARVIAEVLEHTEGFEADAAKQPIEFADVPEHEATRVVDAGAGAIVAPIDDAPLNDASAPDEASPLRTDAAVAPLEFGEVPLDAALAPLDLDDELPPVDETVAPLALDDAPAAADADAAGFARDLGTPPGADEPVAPALNAGDDALVATSSTIEAVAEHAAPTLSSDDAPQPVAQAADDSVIDVVAVPEAIAPPPSTIRDAMPPAAEAVAPLIIAEAAEAATPTSLGELQYAMPPAASLAIDEDVRAPVDLPVAGGERAVEVSDFRAPIEADAYRAGDVLGTSPIVGIGPTPFEQAAAQEAEARAIAEQDRADDHDADDLVVDQAALDAADQRIDAPTPAFAPTFDVAPEHVEPIAVDALSSSTLDASAALDLPTPLEHQTRPLIAADEHLDEHHDAAAFADVTAIEPILADASSTTIDAAALTLSVAESAAPVEDEASPAAARVVEPVPSDAAPTILTETDDEIALAAGLPAHADVVNADAAASLTPEPVEPVASADSIADVAEAAPAIAPAASHFEMVGGNNEPTSVVMVARHAPPQDDAAGEDPFADALAMAEGHTFAPAILPPAAPIDENLAKQWQLDESLLEQANHTPQGPIDPLAAGMTAGAGAGYLNLGGIGYIGDPSTDEYEPATSTPKSKKERKPRPRRKVNGATTAPTPAPAGPDAAAQIEAPPLADAPASGSTTSTPPAEPDAPIDAELEALGDAPTPPRKRPATPPRPTRLGPTKRGQAAVEQSFASAAPTRHSPFAEQALPLVDAFGGQNDSFGQQPAEALDVMLARLGSSGEQAGQVLDQPPIVPDAPPTPTTMTTSVLDAHARPVEGQPRAPRPASPTPTPFASHVPISSPTPPRPRRGVAAVARRPMNKLPMLVLLMLVSAGLVALGAWYWPVPRTLQGQLTFENLDKLNTIERTSVQDHIRATLDGLQTTARHLLDDRYGDGFLDRPDAFRAVVSTARFSPEDPNALVVRVTSNVNAVRDDRVRLAALLTAARGANQGLVDARNKLLAELSELQAKQDSASAQHDAKQRELEIVKPRAATLSSDLDALRQMDADIAALDQARQAAAQTLAAREAELKKLQADAAALGIPTHGDAMLAEAVGPTQTLTNFAGTVLTAAPLARFADVPSSSAVVSVMSPGSGVVLLAGSADVIAPIGSSDAAAAATQPAVGLDQLERDRDDAKQRLDQLLQAQTPAAREAREGFDQALNAFAGDVETASKTLGDRPEVLAYVQSARALQKQIAEMTDTLVRRQQQQLTRLGAFKQRLADMTDSSRDQRYAGDEQLKMWSDRLAIAQRRLNAAKDANASPQDVDDIQRQISIAESSIAARKELLDDPKATIVARDLESMIETTQRDMAADRQQNEKLLADVTDAFRRQQPAVEKLPDDQKALAQTLAGRLAQIDLARQRYTNSLGLVAGGEALAIAQAREKFDALDQQLTQRRAAIDASAQAQAAEMERRARIARSLDDARAALIAARAEHDQAEAAFAAKSAPREALARQIEVGRQAGQQKDALEAQLATANADIDARRGQLVALQNRLSFCVYPKDPLEVPRELETDRLDPRLGFGAAGLVGLLCIFSPMFVVELRRRSHHALAQAVVGGDRSTNFPPHATAA